MATDDLGKIISLPASGDLSEKQYYFAALSSGAAAVAGAGVDAIGILQNDADGATKTSSVATAGISKMVAGAAITIDDEIMVKSDGTGITATSTNYIVAYALEAASAAGDIISVLLRSSGVKAA